MVFFTKAIKFWAPIIIFFFASCSKEVNDDSFNYPEIMEVPLEFPIMDVPDNNLYSIDRWTLGKALFYEVAFSIDSSISCASCHQQNLAFADDKAVSFGAKGRRGRRNAPSLGNVGFLPYYTREGGISTLEKQIFIPIQEHDEFANNIVLIVDKLKKIPFYNDLAVKAYGREFDPFVLTRALANFERSLITGWSKYDEYQNGNLLALTDNEIRGKDLFFSSEIGCSNCHGGFNFTNNDFENNGLYEDYIDLGRARLTGENEDIAKFKIPSLRNVGLTAPYMHDGSLSNLDQVIEHYNIGGKIHFNKSDKLKPLNLDQNEKEDFVAFLHSLSDSIFITNPIFFK